IQRFFKEGVKIERFRLDSQLAAQNARGVKEVFDQLTLALGVAFDGLKRALVDRVAGLPRSQHLRPAEHGAQSRAQFVRDDAEKFVFRPPVGLGLAAPTLLASQTLLAARVT